MKAAFKLLSVTPDGGKTYRPLTIVGLVLRICDAIDRDVS